MLLILWACMLPLIIVLHCAQERARAQKVQDKKKIYWFRAGRETGGILLMVLPQFLPGPPLPLWVAGIVALTVILKLCELYVDVRELLALYYGPRLGPKFAAQYAAQNDPNVRI